MYEARQNINVYPRTISTVRNRYNRPPQAIQRHVFLNGKVIGIDRAQKEFERMKLELNIKQITFLKHLIESDKHYLFSELIGLLGIDNRKDKSLKPKTAPLIADKMNIGYKNRREALKKVLKELDLPKEM